MRFLHVRFDSVRLLSEIFTLASIWKKGGQCISNGLLMIVGAMGPCMELISKWKINMLWVEGIYF